MHKCVLRRGTCRIHLSRPGRFLLKISLEARVLSIHFWVWLLLIDLTYGVAWGERIVWVACGPMRTCSSVKSSAVSTLVLREIDHQFLIYCSNRSFVLEFLVLWRLFCKTLFWWCLVIGKEKRAAQARVWLSHCDVCVTMMIVQWIDLGKDWT